MRKTIRLGQSNAGFSRRIREQLFLLQLEQVIGIHHLMFPKLISHLYIPGFLEYRSPPSAAAG